MYCWNCDLAVPGSPQSNIFISDRKVFRPASVKFFFVPPNNCNKIPFLISSRPKIFGATDKRENEMIL
jgi:hypothetical protein